MTFGKKIEPNMFFDSLYESIANGGWVLWPIYLIGVWAIFILLNLGFNLGFDFYRKDFDALEVLFKRTQEKSKSSFNTSVKASGICARVLEHIYSLKSYSVSERRNKAQIYIKNTERKMEYGLFFVGVLAGAAPLLGLLGTVQGMVTTFDTITLYGNSNPVLLADGISEALLTTQSGLVIAFPVLLLKHRIEDRIFYIKKQLQRLGMFALDEMEKSN
jgi:biopolymer transport protein ExbB